MKKLALTVASTLVLSSALAKDNWVSGDGKAVRDASGECIRNGVWTPATANPECVKDLAPKPQPAPAPRPAAQVQTPTPPAPAPRVQAPAPQPVRVTMRVETLFDFDRSVIKPEGRVIIDGFITSLNGSQLKYDTVIVIGHTDSIGSDEYNMRLGQRRAEAVKAYLVSKGIDSRTIRTESRGERDPVADNKTALGRAKNRRAVVEVIGTRN